MTHDVAVIGAGAFGGWTALNLTRMGKRVVLVDSWGAGNSRSSSGGETRVIRCMYGEDAIYIDFVLRAFEMWRAFEREQNLSLLRKTGALWMCSASDDYVAASIPHLEQNGLAVEALSTGQAAARYPQVDFDGVRSVYLEHEAGYLRARSSCRAVVQAFEAEGGTVLTSDVKTPFFRNGHLDRVDVTDNTLVAEQFVFCCGAWLPKLFPDLLGQSITVTRQDVFYFGVPAGDKRFAASRLPVWVDLDDRIMYGVPDVAGRGFKAGDDTRGDRFDPTTDHREPTTENIARTKSYVARRFPALRDAPLLESRVCQYANSPDGHLVIDRVPGADNVWIVGGGSGHAFKLGPSLGEYVAGKVVHGGMVEPMFSIERQRGQQRSTQWGLKNGER